MKIALYVPSWPPGLVANGIVTYASTLVPVLRRLGHEVYVLTPNKSNADDDPYTVDLRKFSTLPTLRDRIMYKLAPAITRFNAVSAAIVAAIRELVRKNGVDVLEIEESFGWNFEITRSALLPVVVRLHGPWFLTGGYDDSDKGTPLNRRRESFEGRGIRSAQFVSSPSADVLRAVKNRYGLVLANSRIIPNPIEAAPERKAWSPTSCDHNVLLFVGRFDKLKGGDLVLRMFNELASAYPALRLTFVGPDKGIKQSLTKIMSFREFVFSQLSEECQSRIEFCGPINHSEVMCLRAKSFITIVASQHEIMPYSVLEAMSVGSPLIATAVGGISEMVTDNRNGLLVPSQDVRSMVAACKRLLDDRVLAAQLGRQARHDCRERYEPDVIAKRAVALYEEAVEEFKGGRSIYY